MERRTFCSGEVVFLEDSYAETMYEVVSGKVGIYASYGTEHERLLAVLGAGQVFGEMGVVEYYARSATAVAEQDATVVNEITAGEFLSYFKDQPLKVLEIMRQVSGRLRETNDKYVDACKAVYEAIEAEEAGRRRSNSLRARLSNMIRQLKG